jgi:outer membrane protein OmpA-like peptidoglycan-associated protein
MTFSKTLLFASLLSIQSIANADDSQHLSSKKEGAGFGVGAIIGGLLAGPPGAIIGAAGGSWFGHRETEAERTIAKLEKELNAKSIELAFQQNEVATTKAAFQNKFQRVVHSQEIQSLEKLSQGISYVIYYKTNDDKIRQNIRPQIKQLIELIRPYPQIQVQIEGHADSRGSEQYNMALSKKRIDKVRAEFINAGIPGNRLRTHAYGEKQTQATKGDTEAYVFDRRVTINLTLDREV